MFNEEPDKLWKSVNQNSLCSCNVGNCFGEEWFSTAYFKALCKHAKKSITSFKVVALEGKGLMTVETLVFGSNTKTMFISYIGI